MMTTTLALPESALVEQFCYLETTGRVTGRPHTIEIWFAGDGRTLYLLAGGGERADWVKNLRRNPAVRVRIGETTYVGQAAVIAGEPDELPARQAVAAKYYGCAQVRSRTSGRARRCRCGSTSTAAHKRSA